MTPHKNSDFDQSIRRVLHQNTPEPSSELNAQLSARLWQRQEELQKPKQRTICLWWLPMVANLIVCGVPAVLFALPIMPLWAHLASLALAWLAIGGVVLTFIGLKTSNFKENTTIVLRQHH